MNKEKKETKNNQSFDIYKVIEDLEEFFGGNTNAAVRVVNDAAISAAYKKGYEARKKEAKENDRDYKDGLEDGRFEILYTLEKVANDNQLLLLFGADNINWVIEKYAADEIIEKVEKFEKEQKDGADVKACKEAEDLTAFFKFMANEDIKTKVISEEEVQTINTKNVMDGLKGCHNCKRYEDRQEFLDNNPCKGCFDHSKWEKEEPLPCMTCKHRNNNCQLNGPSCHYDRQYLDDEIEKCKHCMHYPASGISSNAVCILCEDNQYFDSIHDVKVGDVVVGTKANNKLGKGIVTELHPRGTGEFAAFVVWDSGVSGNYHTAMLRKTGKRYDSLEKLINLMRR